MTPNKQRLLERLTLKLQKAVSDGNYLEQMKFHRQIEELKAEEKKVQQTTLFQVLKDYTPEERRKMTVKMITAVSISDMLLSVTLDIESAFRELGIIDVPILREIKEISRSCRKVVSTISQVHNTFLDEHYCDVTDEIEAKVVPMLKNYIMNEMNKAGKV
jgi:DNA primase catalytic subunit